MFICIIIVYFGLFGVGYLLYGKTLFGTIMLIISFVLSITANNIMSEQYIRLILFCFLFYKQNKIITTFYSDYRLDNKCLNLH